MRVVTMASSHSDACTLKCKHCLSNIHKHLSGQRLLYFYNYVFETYCIHVSVGNISFVQKLIQKIDPKRSIPCTCTCSMPLGGRSHLILLLFVVNWLQRTKNTAKQSITPLSDMQHVNRLVDNAKLLTLDRLR